jgi:hypothetical protein
MKPAARRAWSVAARVGAAVAYAALCGGVIQALSVSVAWFRNPRALGHLPDVIHESVDVLVDIPIPWTGVAVDATEAVEAILSTLLLLTIVFVLSHSWRWCVVRSPWEVLAHGPRPLQRIVPARSAASTDRLLPGSNAHCFIRDHESSLSPRRTTTDTRAQAGRPALPGGVWHDLPRPRGDGRRDGHP